MKIERFDNGDEYWTVESIRDLRDWVVMHEEPWKDGVVRLHCRRLLNWSKLMEFRQIYCRTDILRPATQVETVQ